LVKKFNGTKHLFAEWNFQGEPPQAKISEWVPLPFWVIKLKSSVGTSELLTKHLCLSSYELLIYRMSLDRAQAIPVLQKPSQYSCRLPRWKTILYIETHLSCHK
jgi:hypothetical protein